MGFHVSLDLEALDTGDSILAELQHAIAGATLHVVIFSPNYAQSLWCLAELSFMLKSVAKIIPIFGHVDSSRLRWFEQGKGIYDHAFAEHEKKGRYTQEKLHVWKTALFNSSFISGYTVNYDKGEATFLKNIMICSLQIMKELPSWVDPPRFDEMVQRGILGMGGFGKSTLAKELFNRNFYSFERCSYVFDHGDVAFKSLMSEKQKKLLADLGVHHLQFDQLNALLPNKDNLGSHSMVIVTTWELGVLKSWSLFCIYKMAGLYKPHAKHNSFAWHSFL